MWLQLDTSPKPKLVNMDAVEWLETSDADSAFVEVHFASGRVLTAEAALDALTEVIWDAE